MSGIERGVRTREGLTAGAGRARCRVVLAGQLRLERDMLRNLLEPEFAVVGATHKGGDLLKLAECLRPDIALIELGIPERSGLAAGQELRAHAAATRLVYLTSEMGTALAAEAFGLGASGYLLKTDAAVDLQSAMRIVAQGGKYLTNAIAAGNIDALCQTHSDSLSYQLSSRERQVLKLLVAGLSMKTVAHHLGIMPRTVAFHKYHAMKLLSLRSNAELIEFAIRHGLLGESR